MITANYNGDSTSATTAMRNVMDGVQQAISDLPVTDQLILEDGRYTSIRIFDGNIPGKTSDVIGLTDRCAAVYLGPDFLLSSDPSVPAEDTTFHEFGHAIDDMLGHYSDDGGPLYTQRFSESDEFVDLFNLLINSLRSNTADATAAARADAYQELFDKNPSDVFADIYESSRLNGLGDPARLNDVIVNLDGNLKAGQVLTDFGPIASAMQRHSVLWSS